MNKIAIGSDIGGSHITCQLYDLTQNRAIEDSKIRRPVDCHASGELIPDSWVDAIRVSANRLGLEKLAGIGFAMPGPFDYPNGIAWFKNVEKFESLYGVNVRDEILQRLDLPGHFPVRFMNDAVCFAIGESFHGNAAKHGKLLAITLGTGFGTTFILDHLPVAGEDGIPDDGFLYHIPFGNSIADDYFSTRWFLNEYETKTGLRISGMKELAENAGKDVMIPGLFKTFGFNLGSFLAPGLKGLMQVALLWEGTSQLPSICLKMKCLNSSI